MASTEDSSAMDDSHEQSNFGKFKIFIADQLTETMVTELATLFGYSRRSIDELQRLNNQGTGLAMVQKMEESGKISATDISPLLDVLRQREYDGVVKKLQNYASSARPGKHPGYCRFQCDLAAALTHDIIVELATLFGYSRGILDDLDRTEKGVGRKMVNCMDERGDISDTSIDPLLEKLRQQEYSGVADEVQRSFEENMSTTSIKYSGKTGSFVENLKKGYKRMTDSVRPIPFQQSCRSVESIFVESHVEKMEEKTSESEPEIWKKMEFTDDIVADPADRIMLEGDPGYGKSTLMLHLVHKWCTSPLPFFSVLILLRLREVGNLNFFEAIQQCILPKESSMSAREIQEILTSEDCKRILIILEGYDEFDGSDSSDIISLISSSMFPSVKVIITTRPEGLPKYLVRSSFSRLRLKGFDESTQREYIQKVITENEDAISSLIDIFKNNTLLCDICQTPLFFALFAHLLHTEPNLQSLQSVTMYLGYLVKCFFGHQLSKSELPSKQITQQDHERFSLQIGRLAFEGLKSGKKKLEWDADDLKAAVASECYELFTRVGILLEEAQSEPTTMDRFGYCTGTVSKFKTKFFHKTFQEYYAALYVLQQFEEQSSKSLVALLKGFSSSELNFLFLFTCGLDSSLASCVIPYFEEHYDDTKLLYLCLLETNMAHGKVPAVTASVKKLCEQFVMVDRSDNALLQRAKVNVLSIAHTEEIPIYKLVILEPSLCAAADFSSLILSSGLSVPSLSSVTKVVLVMNGRELKLDEWMAILAYSVSYPTMRKLKLSDCLLPHSTPVGSLQKSIKGVMVLWRPLTLRTYCLNANSGRWQYRYDSSELTEGNYRDLVAAYRHYRSYTW